MNKKTVYDDLLGFKVKPDDVKPIADLFIDLQDNGVNISLKDLLYFYNKKIRFERFKKIITQAIENKLDIPIEELKKVSLTGNDFLNLVDGTISAQKESMEVKMEDIEYFAKMKINIPELLAALKKVHQYDDSVVLNDFARCQNCLYESKSFVDDLIELKNYEKSILLKDAINLQFEKGEAKKILSLYKKLKWYNTEFSFKEMIDIKAKGIDVKDILEGFILSERQEIRISKELILKIINKGLSVHQIIKESITPDYQEEKPIRILLKSGLELHLKISFLFLADIENTIGGIGKQAVVKKIRELFAKKAQQYKNTIDYLTKAVQTAKEIESEVNSLSPAYRIIDLTIEDYIVARHLHEEQLLVTELAKQKREEIRRAMFLKEKKSRKKQKQENINTDKDASRQ